MQTRSTYQHLSSLFILFLMSQVALFGSGTPTKSTSGIIESFAINFDLVNGLIVLEASVDHIKGKYILDTGCSFIAVDGPQGKGDIELSSTEFAETASETSLANFELGNISMQNIDALAFDMKKIEAIVGTDIDGLIGTQVMEDHNILIDYTEMKVYFIGEDSPHLDINALSHTIVKSAMTTHSEKSFIEVQIQNESYTLLLDSGANISVLHKGMKKLLRSTHQKNNVSPIVDDFTLDELSINRVKVSNLGVIYRDLSLIQSDTGHDQIDGILSLSSLDVDKVLFDYRSGQVIFFWAHDDIVALK